MEKENLIDELSKGRFKMDEYAFRAIRAILRKTKVTEEFIERWADKFDSITQQGLIIDIGLIKQMLKEAGIRVA